MGDKQRFWIVGILFSVVVTFLSFPPFPLGILMLVGMTPVFLAVETATSSKQAFFRAWLYVFLGNSAICFWVAHTMHHFAGLPWILSYPCVFILSVFEQSAWPIWAAFRHIAKKRWGSIPPFWSAALLVLLDIAWPKFFPNTLGNSFYTIPWLSQAADVFGVVGLTGLIVVTNESLALAILRRPGWRRDLITAGVVLALTFGYGFFRLNFIQGLKPVRTVRVALIQPNINPVARVREALDKHGTRFALLEPLLRLSRQALAEKPELLFWPETAISNTFRATTGLETLSVTQAIEKFQKQSNVPILFGARDHKEGRLYNALFLLEGERLAHYYKHKLLWLGESIPLADTIPALAEMLRKQGSTHFSPGPGPTLIDWNGLKLRPLICLEGLYSEYSLSPGADLIVSATNDAWFGVGQEPALHLNLTRFRAIENRVPLLRSTTTGFSGVVGIDGQMIWQSELQTEAAKTVEVPVYGKVWSPLTYWGSWFVVLLALAWIILTPRARWLQNWGK